MATEGIRRHTHEDIASLCSVFDGNHFTISDEFTSEGIPYYRGQDVVGNFFIEQSAPNFITDEAFNRPYMTRSHLKRGDVLLSIIGTIGELSLVDSRGCYVLGQSGGLMELDVFSCPGPPQAVSV